MQNGQGNESYKLNEITSKKSNYTFWDWCKSILDVNNIFQKANPLTGDKNLKPS